MAAHATFKLVESLLAGCFENFSGELRPDTDLMKIVERDPEELEWALARLQDALDLKWPTIEIRGKPRKAQLFLPPTLTVAELCEIVEAGEWPASWVRPGKALGFLWAPH